jgi:hypothetical protein
MESITEDKWDEDIWGIEHEDAASMVKIPKLVFYFVAHASFPPTDTFQSQLTNMLGPLGCKSYSRCSDFRKRNGRGENIVQADYAD